MSLIQVRDVQRSDSDKQDDHHEERKVRADSAVVSRRFFRRIQVGADDVASGGADEQDAGRDFAFGIPSGILTRPAGVLRQYTVLFRSRPAAKHSRIDHRTNSRIHRSDIVSKQQHAPIPRIMRNRIQNRQSDNRRHAQSRQKGRFHFPMRSSERPSQRRDDLHRPERHVEQDRLEAREAEAAHDQGPESRYPAAWDRYGCQQRCPNPRLGVEEAFPDVVPAPLARGDSLLVHA
jgi:hypothetical protein